MEFLLKKLIERRNKSITWAAQKLNSVIIGFSILEFITVVMAYNCYLRFNI